MSEVCLEVNPTETNDCNYQPIDVMNIEPLTDHLFVQWQLAQENIRLGKFVLARPDTHRKQHYTATVISVGLDVSACIKPGCRIVFDQFSDPDKYWDKKYGRIALLSEARQGQLFLLISERTKVEGQEGEYNFDV